MWNCLKNSKWLQIVSYICKKLHLRYLTESWIRLCTYWKVNVLSYRERREKNCASIFNAITECVPLTISFHLYFLRTSKIWSMLHHGLVGQVQIKECYFIFTYTFVTFFCCFSLKKIVFLSFSILFLIKSQISTTKY